MASKCLNYEFKRFFIAILILKLFNFKKFINKYKKNLSTNILVNKKCFKYLKPIYGTAINQRWKHSQIISKAVANGRERKNNMQMQTNTINEFIV